MGFYRLFQWTILLIARSTLESSPKLAQTSFANKVEMINNTETPIFSFVSNRYRSIFYFIFIVTPLALSAETIYPFPDKEDSI